ncbi:MAG: hypothetical protein ILP19_07765 [Oscillospiraceae bacterium]|nr:hypothetical protein [Oscillospiraceae bacterium]
MKGNIHKKLTFEDSTEKRYIKSCFKGWSCAKRINRRLCRRRMRVLLKRNKDVML